MTRNLVYRGLSMKAAVSFAVLLIPAFILADGPHADLPLGKKVADFKLRDYRGVERSLSEVADRKLVVVVFMGCECPVAKLYGPRLAELARDFEPKEVAFLGLNSNQQDSITAIAHYAKSSGIAFPILKDVGNVVADQFGAVRTPEVF